MGETLTVRWTTAVTNVLAAGLIIGLALGALPARRVAAQTCAGDCDGDGTVTVNELVIMVDVALGSAAVSTCVAGDRNGDGAITVNEIITAMNLLLNPSLEISVTVHCELPPDTPSETKNCPDNTPVTLYRCTDLAGCANDPAARVAIETLYLGRPQPPEASGSGNVRFTGIAECSPNITHLYEAPVADDATYVAVVFPGGAGTGHVGEAVARAAGPQTVTISPLSEAAVRLVDTPEQGLENFGAVTFATVLAEIESAVPLASLAGKSPAEAANTATVTAQNDPTGQVQAALGVVLKDHVVVATQLIPPGTDHYELELHDTTTVVLQVTKPSGAVNPCIEVQYYGTGQNVPSGQKTCGDDGVRLNLTELPAGTYDVYVSDRSQTQSGPYDLYYLRLRPEDATALTVDQSQPGALITPGALDPYTFQVTQSTEVVLQAAPVSSSISPCVELWQFDPNGSKLVDSQCDSPSTQLQEIVDAGTYIVVVFDQGNDDEGAYALKLLESPVHGGTPTPTPPPTPTRTLSPTPTATTTPTNTPTYSATPTPTLTATIQPTSMVSNTSTPKPGQLLCDTPLTGTINDPLVTNLLPFTVADQEMVTIRVVPGTGSSLSSAWRLLDKTGHGVSGGCGQWGGAYNTYYHSNGSDCGPLPATGNPYSIEVGSGTGTGSYEASLQRLTAAAGCNTTALPCDAPLNGTITDPIVTNLLSFTVTDQEIVTIRVVPKTGSSLSSAWRLLDKTGHGVSGGCGQWGGAYNTYYHSNGSDCGPLPATGNPYSIEVGSGTGTGSYEASLQRLTAAAGCNTTALPCDAPLNGTITDPIVTNLLSFTVADQEMVTIRVVPGTGSSLSSAWRLLDKGGHGVSGGCGQWGGAYNTYWHSNGSDCGPLPATGNPYSIEVGSGTGTGSYEASLQRLTAAAGCNTTALPCDAPLNGTITDPIVTNLLSFTVADQEMVTIRVVPGTGSSLSSAWRLLDKGGHGVSGGCGQWGGAYNTYWHSNGSDCGPLPATGDPYSIEVGSGTGTGSYEASLQRLTAAAGCNTTALACGTPLNGTITDPIVTNLLSFTVADQEMVTIRVVPGTGSSLSSAWRLLDKTGHDVSGGCGQWGGAYNTYYHSNGSDCGPLPATGNPYSIEVGSGTGTGSYEAIVTFLTGCV